MKLKFTLISALISFVICSDSAKAQWIQTSGPPVSYITSLTSYNGTVFAGTGTDGFHLTNDGGSNWTKITAINDQFAKLLVTNAGKIYAGTNDSLFVSNDNGVTWSGFSAVPDINVILFDGANIFAGTYSSGILLSTDNGVSWNPMNSGLLNLNITGLAAIGTNLFAATKAGGMSLSTNNGVSWTSINNGLLPGTNELQHLTLKGADLYLASSGKGIYKSSNNGANWAQVNTGLTQMDVEVLATDGTNLFAGTYSNTLTNSVFISSDNGANWTDIDNGTFQKTIRAFTISGPDVYLGTGTNMAMVWKREIADVAAGISENNDRLQIAIYPNPSKGKLVVETPFDSAEMTIFNVTGAKILNQRLTGKSNIVDLSNSPKGIYFVQVVIKDKIINRKVIIE